MREPDTLLALVALYHRGIDETLLLHQEALLLRDHALASEALDLAIAQLQVHIDGEDRWLLPLAPRVSERFPPVVYAAEHGKIRELLAAARAGLAALAIDDRRAVIALIDQERVLKNVVEHHEAREEQGLLPGLDSILSPDEHAAVLAGLAAEWRLAMAALAPRLAALRSALATL